MYSICCVCTTYRCKNTDITRLLFPINFFSISLSFCLSLSRTRVGAYSYWTEQNKANYPKIKRQNRAHSFCTSMYMYIQGWPLGFKAFFKVDEDWKGLGVRMSSQLIMVSFFVVIAVLALVAHCCLLYYLHIAGWLLSLWKGLLFSFLLPLSLISRVTLSSEKSKTTGCKAFQFLVSFSVGWSSVWKWIVVTYMVVQL